MKESEVWQEATKIWEKREKIKDFDGVSVVQLESRLGQDDWGIDVGTKYFYAIFQVRRFLDGLE